MADAIIEVFKAYPGWAAIIFLVVLGGIASLVRRSLDHVEIMAGKRPDYDDPRISRDGEAADEE